MPALVRVQTMHSLLDSIKTWTNAGLAFLYPEVCQVCRAQRATPAQGFICSDCRSTVSAIKRPFCERCGLPYPGAVFSEFECSNCRGAEFFFETARSAVVAKGTLLDVIHAYKYHRAVWFEPYLAELLVSRAQSELTAADWDCIVPVPLHPTKEREREFNQAERLAKPLSAATGIPYNPRLLRRDVPTETQTWLSREERRANVRGAFSLRDAAGLSGRRVVLVDDVFTTGATTNACAQVLKHGGASSVCVWTLARGI